MPWTRGSARISLDQPRRPFLTARWVNVAHPLRYAVDQLCWRVYPDAVARVELDFRAVYGPTWGFLTGLAPEQVALAEGSPVAVYPGERLRTGQPT